MKTKKLLIFISMPSTGKFTKALYQSLELLGPLKEQEKATFLPQQKSISGLIRKSGLLKNCSIYLDNIGHLFKLVQTNCITDVYKNLHNH